MHGLLNPALMLVIIALSLLCCMSLGAAAKDATDVEDLAGEYVARAFVSKNWQLRDAAVGWLGRQVRSSLRIPASGV